MKTQTETLRSELIEMVRLSQRTVDYAIKAHESGRPEYVQHVCFGRDRLVCLNKKICCAILEMRKSLRSVDTEVDFGECIRTISVDLFDVCQHAYKISFLSVGFADCNVYEPPCYRVTMGANINSAMRLCAMAIINNEVKHAEGARREIGYWRSVVASTGSSRGYVKEPSHISGCHECTITRCMLKMMDNIYTIAVGLAAMVAADNKITMPSLHS
jgi:hypothetical protein